MSQYYQIIEKQNISSLSEDKIELAAKVVYDRKKEFDDYFTNNTKLQAVKSLKEYTGLGLRDSKDFIDLITNKKIKITSQKEDRRNKLESLAKMPLIEEIIEKIRKSDDNKLSEVFKKFTIDELFNFDELFLNENE